MKLTQQYVEIISQWWTQLLINNKNLKLAETTIDRFKANIMQFLDAFDYEAGQLFHARANSLEFSPHDNPLSLALISAIRSVGLAPNVFPYGAELKVSANYEIYVCNGYTKELVRLEASNTSHIDSFDSSSDSLPAEDPANFGSLKTASNATNDDAEYSLDGSSFLIDFSTSHATSSESKTSHLKQSFLLKRNGLFNAPEISASTLANKRQRSENNNHFQRQHTI